MLPCTCWSSIAASVHAAKHGAGEHAPAGGPGCDGVGPAGRKGRARADRQATHRPVLSASLKSRCCISRPHPGPGGQGCALTSHRASGYMPSGQAGQAGQLQRPGIQVSHMWLGRCRSDLQHAALADETGDDVVAPTLSVVHRPTHPCTGVRCPSSCARASGGVGVERALGGKHGQLRRRTVSAHSSPRTGCAAHARPVRTEGSCPALHTARRLCAGRLRAARSSRLAHPHHLCPRPHRTMLAPLLLLSISIGTACPRPR